MQILENGVVFGSYGHTVIKMAPCGKIHTSPYNLPQ